MTWNSRASERARTAVALQACLFALTACVLAPATDAPAPALTETLQTVAPSETGPYDDQRVTIRTATAQIVSKEDPWVERIVHPDDYENLSAPILISAEVARPFRDLSRTASPVIVLNGRPLTNSIVVRDETDRVYAVAEDSGQLGPVVSVQVGWFGALSRTLSSAVEVRLQTGN